jgi:hypothetical protein
LTAEALWYAFTGGEFGDRDLEILVLSPGRDYPNRFYTSTVLKRAKKTIRCSKKDFFINHGISEIKRRGDSLTITRYDKRNYPDNYPHCFTTTIRGVFLGENDSSGYGGKGATPDVLMIDSAAYVNNDYLKEVINPMIYTNSKMKVIMASTPNWSDNNFFEKCCKNSEYFKEFYFSSLDRPDWEEIGDRIEECFGNDKEKWNMEILAEFKCEPTVSELLFIGRELQEKLDKIEEEKDDSAWIRDGKRGLYLL